MLVEIHDKEEVIVKVPGSKDLDHPKVGGLSKKIQGSHQDGKSSCTKKYPHVEQHLNQVIIIFVPGPKLLVWKSEVPIKRKLMAPMAESALSLIITLQWLAHLQCKKWDSRFRAETGSLEQ